MLVVQTWLAFIYFVDATDHFANVATELQIKHFKWLQIRREAFQVLGGFLYGLTVGPGQVGKELAKRIYALSGSIFLLFV
ncbi:hypothetical protein AAVH_28252, partial [Aphelenchoides avenae]